MRGSVRSGIVIAEWWLWCCVFIMSVGSVTTTTMMMSIIIFYMLIFTRHGAFLTRLLRFGSTVDGRPSGEGWVRFKLVAIVAVFRF